MFLKRHLVWFQRMVKSKAIFLGFITSVPVSLCNSEIEHSRLEVRECSSVPFSLFLFTLTEHSWISGSLSPFALFCLFFSSDNDSSTAPPQCCAFCLLLDILVWFVWDNSFSWSCRMSGWNGLPSCISSRWIFPVGSVSSKTGRKLALSHPLILPPFRSSQKNCPAYRFHHINVPASWTRMPSLVFWIYF